MEKAVPQQVDFPGEKSENQVLSDVSSFIRRRSTISAKEWKSECINMSPLWLMSPSHGDKGAHFSMVDPVSSNKYYLDMPSSCIDFPRILHSSDGWLLMYDETSNRRLKLRLSNPITKSTVCLPELDFMENFMVTTSNDSPNCTVVGISWWQSRLSFIEFDWSDSEKREWNWRDIEEEDGAQYTYVTQSNDNPVCIQDKDYYFLVGVDGDLASYVYSEEKDSFYLRIHHLELPCSNCYQRRFLVAGREDDTLLSVYIGREWKWLRVFEWDGSKMAKEWVEVEDLGNHNVYLSTMSCICKEAEFPAKGNRIYLPMFHDGHVVYYSLDTRKFQAGEGDSSVVVSYYGSVEQLQCCWFETNLALK